MFTCGAVELSVGTLEGRDTYYARLGDAAYVLVADDETDSNYDPVDHWHLVNAVGEAGDRIGTDAAGTTLRNLLDRAALLVDKIRPAAPVAHISEPIAHDDDAGTLSDDDFNRLADEIAASCPGVGVSLLYARALRLKELEGDLPGKRIFI